MQSVHATLLARLQNSVTDPATERKPCDLYEVYANDYIPDATNGFEPADAEETFSAIEITWNGIAYRRSVVSRGSIDKNMGAETNSVTVTFSNIDKYVATWAQTTPIEGKWLVIRYVEADITAGSIVLFVGRLGKPSTINLKSFSISAAQDLVDLNAELPLRTFSAQDPEGRSADDDEYEGIRLVTVAGSHQYPVIVPAQNTFARLIGQRDTIQATQQWSSVDRTAYGNPIPEVLGRAQMKLIPFFSADKGLFVAYLMAACAGPIAAIENIKNRTSGFSEPFNLPGPVGPIIHLGDLGGTGTNQGNTNQFQESGKFSHLAYFEGASTGSASDVEDGPPEITAIIKGRRIPVPDSSGVYSSITDEASLEWTDNPVHIARWIFIVSGAPEEFLEDSINYLTSLWCDEPLLDESNTERVFIAQADIGQTGTLIRRFRPTGTIDGGTILYTLGEGGVDPTDTEPDYEPYDPEALPDTYVVVPTYRKRYTFNAPITERVKAKDFLTKVVYPAARLFDRVNWKGKVEIHSERAEDHCYLRVASIVGATAILVDDVTPWKTNNLLKGWAHIEHGETTSENRRVSSATYSADGNAITLVASDVGAVTATASGATLSGGSTTVQASGTVTITGSPAAGNTVTVTINGTAVVYTVAAGDTANAVAGMVAVVINANPTLRKFVRATSATNVVTITAKYGVLNLSSALANAHDSGDEVIRIAMPFSTNTQSAAVLAQSGLTKANIKADTYNYPLGSEQSSVNQIKGNFRDAVNDFALTPFLISDPDHIEQTGKKKPLEVDYSGVDNWNQVYRLGNNALAKNRECDWFDQLTTGNGEALLLEEGDLKTASDDSGGLINVLTRIESISIAPNHEVTIRKARLYSTEAFSDTVVERDIPIPSTLRYVQTVDTQSLPMDLPDWRATDPIDVDGFHVAYARSLDAGDWRGTVIYIDASGAYVSVTIKLESQVPMGEALTALDSVSDFTVLDETSDVRIQITTPGQDNPTYQLQSTTDLKLAGGANLFALGINGRWELGQFKTPTLVGGTTDTYDLTDLWRGRHGTEANAGNHAIADKFVLLTDHDGNDMGVVFVPVAYELLGETFNVKAVTTNQDVADATAQSFTWEGEYLRNAPITNMIAYKEGSGLWAFEWQSGDPLELQKYTLKVLTSGGSETLPSGRPRSMSVIPGISNPVLFETNLSTTTTTEGPYGSLLIETDNDSGNNTLPNESEFQRYRSLVTLDEPGWWIEFDIDVSSSPSGGAIRLIDANDPFETSDFFFEFGVSRHFVGDDPSRDWVVDTLVLEKPAGGSPATLYATINSDISTYRYRIQSSGSEVRFYRNYAGPGSQVMAISTIAPPSNLKIFGVNGVQNIVLGGLKNPYTTYGVSQHEEDFTTIQSSLRVKVYQERADGIAGIERDITF